MKKPTQQQLQLIQSNLSECVQSLYQHIKPESHQLDINEIDESKHKVYADYGRLFSDVTVSMAQGMYVVNLDFALDANESKAKPVKHISFKCKYGYNIFEEIRWHELLNEKVKEKFKTAWHAINIQDIDTEQELIDFLSDWDGSIFRGEQ